MRTKLFCLIISFFIVSCSNGNINVGSIMGSNKDLDNKLSNDVPEAKVDLDKATSSGDFKKVDKKASLTKEVSGTEKIATSVVPEANVDFERSDDGFITPLVETVSVNDEGDTLVAIKEEDSLRSGDDDSLKVEEKISLDWLKGLDEAHTTTLEYFKAVLQDARYKTRLGGIHMDRYEDDPDKYAYNEDDFLGFLSSIGEVETKDMLTEIKGARELVDKYSGVGDKEDVQYDLESDLSYAFYQTKVYHKKQYGEILSEIKTFCKSFMKNINNELLLMNTQGVNAEAELSWYEKFKEHLTDKERYVLKLCEILLRDQNMSLEEMNDGFMVLGKSLTQKTLARLDELITSSVIGNVGSDYLHKKMTDEDILNDLESLSDHEKKRLQKLNTNLSKVFKHISSINLNPNNTYQILDLNPNNIYQTIESLIKEAIEDFHLNSYK
ncbi:hypothetical protein CR532_04495 (plasmid) [Candidatus Borreliella tachyglossi]|uniref:Lipoprotein n=1 Tax=Candidatus Borreliella tachyglossi TaxID=1964448 RepID=A0A2S1LY88_9SPIR|nr:hypothetical protein [Candidatus Borreliella tachyglossi]AWG43259.1 hypothetical protein CR532_04495 [Candidatus Borreliella tachyglossi]